MFEFAMIRFCLKNLRGTSDPLPFQAVSTATSYLPDVTHQADNTSSVNFGDQNSLYSLTNI